MRGRRRWVREGGGKGLVCISVLRVCFLVSVLIVKGGIKSGCESHISRGLCVAGYSICENVHAGRHCDPRMRASLSACAPLMVHLQTAWYSTTRIKEVRSVNTVITPGRRQYEGFCQARAPFVASHPVSRIALKVVLYSQLGGQGSAHLSSPS